MQEGILLRATESKHAFTANLNSETHLKMQVKNTVTDSIALKTGAGFRESRLSTLKTNAMAIDVVGTVDEIVNKFGVDPIKFLNTVKEISEREAQIAETMYSLQIPLDRDWYVGLLAKLTNEYVDKLGISKNVSYKISVLSHAIISDVDGMCLLYYSVMISTSPKKSSGFLTQELMLDISQLN